MAAFAASPLAPYLDLGYVPDEVIVKFKPTATESAKVYANSAARAATVKTPGHGKFSKIKLQKGASMATAIAAYKKNKDVEWAEPNYIVQAAFVPNDPLFPRQWNMDQDAYTATVFHSINLGSAWDTMLSTLGSLGDSSVKVAVIDTGVAFENYDSNNDGIFEFLKAPDLELTNFAPGFDFVNNDAHPNDDDGHGTHVTGTIAQSTNNALGCVGIAPDVTIIPVKVLDGFGSGTADAVANGIYFATNAGAKVINMSLGSYSPSQAERDACWYAYNHGVTIAAAAGNGGSFGIAYPGGYNESVIAVGATRFDNQRAPYSDFGQSMDLFFYGSAAGHGLDIMAPGGDSTVDQDLDTFPDGILQQTLLPSALMIDSFGDPLHFDYQYFDGTSMASPHVAGVAALIVSLGVTNPNEVRRILENTTTHLAVASGYDDETGWGLLNAQAAVALAAATAAGPQADAGPNQFLADFDGNGLELVNFDGSSSQAEAGFPIISYQWKENGVLLGEGVIISRNLGLGTHTIALTITDSVGRTDTATCMVTVQPGTPITRVVRVNIVAQGSGSRPNLVALVSIADGRGASVSKAKVFGFWSGSLNKTASPLSTNLQGIATFKAGRLRPGTYAFTITNVTKSGYIFHPELSNLSDTRTFY